MASLTISNMPSVDSDQAMHELFANSGDLDQTPRSAISTYLYYSVTITRKFVVCVKSDNR